MLLPHLSVTFASFHWLCCSFVQSAIWEKHDGLNEMSMWPSEEVPIITTLAKEFANFDRCAQRISCCIAALAATGGEGGEGKGKEGGGGKGPVSTTIDAFFDAHAPFCL